MKKNLLLFATLFFTVTSVAFPLLGFYYLEPSMVNLLFICWFFTLSVFGSACYCDLWIRERRKEANEFEEDIKKALTIHSREEMKAMFRELDKQGV